MAHCSKIFKKHLELLLLCPVTTPAAAAAQAIKSLFRFHSPFLRKEHPSVSLALPPVGVHSTVLQPGHITTLVELLNTVVIWKHPVHLTSMK